MKKRTQEKVAKIFALVVILIMVFQVLLPLFNSVTVNSNSTTASVTATPSAQETQLPAGTVKVSGTPNTPVTVTTTPVTTPSAKK